MFVTKSNSTYETFQKCKKAQKSRLQESVCNVALLTAISLALSPSAQAQEETAQGLEEIIVTGTRVIRDGYETPTPLTVMTLEEIQDDSPANIADVINQLPEFAGSSSPVSNRTSISTGGTGLNTLDLRNLGTTRTLVLLDGKRVVGSQATGEVDINTFPQQLVQRVDIVTGGASAAYGSDAVSGVVNFVLDRKFTGLKVDAQWGGTTKGDNRNWKTAIAGGTPFADGRGHLLLSGELSEVDGVFGCPRDWCEQGWNLINNPDYVPGSGLPERLVLPQTSPSNQAPGSLITDGPLAGVAFGPAGVPYNFAYGSLRRDPWMQGGQWEANDAHQTISLKPSAKRRNLFGRISYEITDRTEVYAQASYGRNENLTGTTTHFAPNNITILADNAFIPDAIRTQMTALNLADLRMGSYISDLDIISGNNTRIVRRYLVGANGELDLFGDTWNWDLYYKYGEAEVEKRFYDRIKTPWGLAIDAVVDPNTGAITCRSTLTDPNNGCVPWNVFGEGVNTDAAKLYVADWSYALETHEQEVIAGFVAGEPFDTWAGPVSLATGFEYRDENGGGIESARNAANESWVGNQAPVIGGYNVTEAFLETVVPLVTDTLDLSAAVRVTDYSTSGGVTTWKAGASYLLTQDLRFRATLSRDIRAPNRKELFADGIFTGNVIVDPFHGNTLLDVQSLFQGNIVVEPEEADTLGLGFVYQPSWLPGLSAAIDYYDIEIDNAIGTVGRQQTVDRCFLGDQAFCDNLVLDANGFITIVKIQPTNFVSQQARGLDIEASYQRSLGDGEFTVRALATHYLENFQDTGSLRSTDTVGQNRRDGPPDWRYRLSGIYDTERVRFTVTGRGISSGVYNNTNIVCSTSCPDSSSIARTVNINDIDGAIFWDVGLTYRIPELAGSESELFLIVKNVTDKDPEIIAEGPGGVAFATPPSNGRYYDILGRAFRVGFRANF